MIPFRDYRWPFLITPVDFAGLSVAVLTLLAGTFVDWPALGLDSQRVLSVFVFALVLWLTKAVPYAVSSVLSVVLLYVYGTVETFAGAVSGYASMLVFFLFLLLLLGNTISEVGFDKRLAGRLLSTTNTPRKSVRSLSGNLFGLALIMPSAVARTAAFIPVVRRIREVYGLDSGSNFERASFLILGHVNTIASMALMTGGGMAITTSEIIRSSVRPVTWVEWAVFMIPPTFVLYAASAFTAELLFPINDVTTAGSSAALDEGSGEPFSQQERIVGWVLIGAVCAWIVGSFAGLPTIVPAILAVTILSFPGINIITAEDITEISWGILFLIGAMLSILDVLEKTGTIDLVVSEIVRVLPLTTLATWQVVATLLLLAVFLRVWFSTASAALIVVLPIVLQFGGRLDVNRFYLALSVLITIGSTTLLPFNTTSVLLSFDRGPLTNRDVFLFGLVTMAYSFLVIAVSWLVYWPLLD